MADHYCIDASSLIDLGRRFPPDVFPGVWQALSKLASSDRLFAPAEVLHEIERGHDELVSWAHENRRMFKKLNQSQLDTVAQILAQFPGLVDPSKETPDADPFVVSLALVTRSERQLSLFPPRVVVVTEESRKKEGIPKVCESYEVEWIRLVELFRREEWRF